MLKKKNNRIEAPPSIARIKRTSSGQRSVSSGGGFVLLDCCLARDKFSSSQPVTQSTHSRNPLLKLSVFHGTDQRDIRNMSKISLSLFLNKMKQWQAYKKYK